MSSDIIAFIPVRGGSKSIPLKNIKLLAGKPLVCHVIDAALAATIIDKIVISTDSEDICSVIRSVYTNNERIEIYNRSEENASDTASTESAMLEYAFGKEFDHIILIQATSPLLTTAVLDDAIRHYFKNSAGGLLSVVRQKRFIWYEGPDKNGHPQNYQILKRPRRQDFDGFLVENGAFYITSRKLLLENGCRISEPIFLWEMPEHTYFELDEPGDWTIIEGLYEQIHSPKTDSINEIAAGIKLFLTDVDGVLTDAGMYYTETGDEIKKFNTRDGKAFELLRNHGILTGIITAENTTIVKRRAEKIKSDFLFQGVKDKVAVLKKIMQETGFKENEVAYIGDDLNDIGILKCIKLSACPANAVKAVKRLSRVVCNQKGGDGCVREFAELILKAKNLNTTDEV